MIETLPLTPGEVDGTQRLLACFVSEIEMHQSEIHWLSEDHSLHKMLKKFATLILSTPSGILPFLEYLRSHPEVLANYSGTLPLCRESYGQLDYGDLDFDLLTWRRPAAFYQQVDSPQSQHDDHDNTDETESLDEPF